MKEYHPRALRLFRTLGRYPFGHLLFSVAVCWKAPYFFSIRPRIRDLAPGRAEVVVRKRRRVQNHIGTMHAIAMANACELAAGTLMEVSVPRGVRWIPKSMSIEYRKKADTDIRAVASLDAQLEAGEGRDVVVPVDVTNDDGQIVVHAKITMYVSPSPAR